MPSVAFRQVDVFTSQPFRGNPVAVVMDAAMLSDEEMQRIASWTNLSETTFVLPVQKGGADYRVRIFTPGGELPFAGHPTIGTAPALLEAGIVQAKSGVLVQECAAGLVHLNVSNTKEAGNIISFELPSPVLSPLSPEQVDDLEKILRCPLDRSLPPALVDVGARWIVAHVADAKTVLNTSPDYSQLTAHDRALKITGVCLYGEHVSSEVMRIEVRSFAPSCGVNEDPVCGSGNGSVAAFMRHHAVDLPATGIVSSAQGQILGRDGKISLKISEGKILVGGEAVTCISGSITL